MKIMRWPWRGKSTSMTKGLLWTEVRDQMADSPRDQTGGERREE